MEVLHHVWELGEARVADVRERILEERPVAYTTVMTVMKKLAKKGFLQFDADGATYVYSAAKPPEEVRQGLLQDVVDKVFLGSRTALVQTLVEDEKLSAAEREEIRRLLDQLDSKHGRPG